MAAIGGLSALSALKGPTRRVGCKPLVRSIEAHGRKLWAIYRLLNEPDEQYIDYMKTQAAMVCGRKEDGGGVGVFFPASSCCEHACPAGARNVHPCADAQGLALE
jgi:hypothetical protein